ncbi:hypothetical protein J437_LFUL015631 [Ladona fulva]|uniref:DUF4371 domain-containing protein n=1 Tax=Ladona fulva TaxID=123851 RepID=A0A8K0KIE7_LADFU|nr:hypothetical protein J437_LFUL015631 [Ladona fulva]
MESCGGNTFKCHGKYWAQQDIPKRSYSKLDNIHTIVKDVNDAKCIAILADETTDISTTEQVELCVQYVDKDIRICEKFLPFIPVVDTSGKGLARIIIEGLLKFSIYLSYVRGPGFD